MNFNYYFELYLKQVVFDFVNSQFEEPITKLELLSISIEDREELNFKCYVSLNVNDNKCIVECDGNLEKLDESFKAVNLKQNGKINFDYILDSHFIPILNKKQLDLVANKFLKKYYAKTSIEKYIDIDLLIKNNLVSNDYSDEVKEQVTFAVKYEGYIERQLRQVEQFKKLENKKIPENIDYDQVKSLRIEAVQKLKEFRPVSIGQASRISGVSPADISVLLVYLGGR